MASNGGMTPHSPAGRAWPLTAGAIGVALPGAGAVALWRSDGLATVGADAWTSAVGGGIGLMFALWVALAAPHRWAARCYFAAGCGFFVSAAGAAWQMLATGRSAAWHTAAMMVDVAGLFLFLGALIGMFLRFPRALLPWRWTAVVLALAGLAAAVTVAAIAGGDMPAAPLIGTVVALVGLIVAQAWIGRRDARVRVRFGLLGLAVVAGGILYLLVNVLDDEWIARPGLNLVIFPLNTLIFIAMGLTAAPVARFAVGGWAAGAMVSVLLATSALLLDALLLLLVTQQQGVALGLAIGAVAAVYLPLRLALVERAERRRATRARAMLERASAVAFATTPEALAARWREALQSLFDPASIRPDAAAPAVRAPAVGDGGAALRLPVFQSLGPVVCEQADRGRRLFSAEDVAVADNLIHILDQLIAGRDSYLRGTEAERQRIARDLHDDVNGLLLSSLLRDDADAMRGDVRGALSEIRSIVRGADERNRSLDSLLAELRHEAATRLEAARIALDWSVGEPVADVVVDHVRYRHILSIVRECVTNVLRHAGAARVCVDIEADGGRFDLTVRDDGRGAATPVVAGNGLVNCRDRKSVV